MDRSKSLPEPGPSAQTKGKTESGVGYVKHNAVAGLSFVSFSELEAYLTRWMLVADQRVHGTTHEQPCVRFDRDERTLMRPLPANPIPAQQRRVTRRVAPFGRSLDDYAAAIGGAGERDRPRPGRREAREAPPSPPR